MATVLKEELSDLIECPVCFEPYDDDDHKPLRLPRCGHTLCKFCVCELVDERKCNLQCPMCQQLNHIKSVAKLPEQIPTKQLMARLAGADGGGEVKATLNTATDRSVKIASTLENVNKTTIAKLADVWKGFVASIVQSDAKCLAVNHGIGFAIDALEEFQNEFVINENQVIAALVGVFESERYELELVKGVLEPHPRDVRKRVVEGTEIIDDTMCSNFKVPVMLVAAREGRLDVIKYLHESAGTDVTQCNEYGHSAIFVACCCNHLDVVRYLVETCGVDANTAAGDGVTCATAACLCNNAALLRYLVERGADPTVGGVSARVHGLGEVSGANVRGRREPHQPQPPHQRHDVSDGGQ